MALGLLKTKWKILHTLGSAIGQGT